MVLSQTATLVPTLTAPATSSLAAGTVAPIPTLPVGSILTRSAPLVAKPISFVAAPNIPVFVFPENAYPGAAAVPAAAGSPVAGVVQLNTPEPFVVNTSLIPPSVVGSTNP